MREGGKKREREVTHNRIRWTEGKKCVGRWLCAIAERSEGKQWVVCGEEEKAEVMKAAEGMNNKAEGCGEREGEERG